MALQMRKSSIHFQWQCFDCERLPIDRLLMLLRPNVLAQGYRLNFLAMAASGNQTWLVGKPDVFSRMFLSKYAFFLFNGNST